jgi:hypothetical protein
MFHVSSQDDQKSEYALRGQAVFGVSRGNASGKLPINPAASATAANYDEVLAMAA